MDQVRSALAGLLVAVAAHCDAQALRPMPQANAGQMVSPITQPAALADQLDGEAARLLELVIARPGDVSNRNRLVAHYRKQERSERIAQLFEATVRFLESDQVEPTPLPPAPRPATCSFHSSGSVEELKALVRRVLAASVEVSDEIGRDKAHEGRGLMAAERALQTYGPYCPLLAEWSCAYLWQAPHDWRKNDPLLWEFAVRELVTLSGENVFPVGDEGNARVYDLVGGMFSLRKDRVTAYVALRIAETELEKGSLTGSWERESFKSVLRQWLEGIRPEAEEQRRGKH